MKDLNSSRIDIIKKFESEILGNTRGVYIYLPPGYSEDKAGGYPVVIMHAGQRVFPIAKRLTSWHVEKTLDRLILDGQIEPVVVVAIAFLKPITFIRPKLEYMYPFPDLEKSFRLVGNALHYSRFIIDELLPYVEDNYNVSTCASKRAIIGASAGGSVSYHIAMENPHIFSMAGMMSTTLYLPKKKRRVNMLRKYQRKSDIRMWIDQGDIEEGYPIEEIKAFMEELIAMGYEYEKDFMFHLEKGALHEEKYWGARAHMPFLYFFGTEKGRNALSVNDDVIKKPIIEKTAIENPVLENEVA